MGADKMMMDSWGWEKIMFLKIQTLSSNPKRLRNRRKCRRVRKRKIKKKNRNMRKRKKQI